jgi:hypothetical protein
MYTFYHIGNILDDRKNFRSILEAFVRLNDPNTRLIVKATCNQDVSINLPRVKIINGLISDEEMEDIHAMGDCYVSFSNLKVWAWEPSRRHCTINQSSLRLWWCTGVHQNTVTIECELQELERDDFLFKKGMVWGKPNPSQLLEFMRDVSQKKLRYMDHTFTKNLVGKENVLEEFLVHVIGKENTEADQNST